MVTLLKSEEIEKAKTYIFTHGRLVDRQLIKYFFGDGNKQACLKALFAYQNEDGGFGNAIEPDLSCPDSSAIGAESAMYTLELLESHEPEIISNLVRWIKTNQNAEGYIDHPPKGLFGYPHQRWWETPDKERILALAGILKHWGYEDRAFFEKVRAFFLNTSLPDGDIYYSYPRLIYLKYCGTVDDDQAKLSNLLERLPAMLHERRTSFPLFTRLWFYASDYVGKDILTQAATDLARAFQEDGGFENPYPDLPWWRPITTVDSMVLLKKKGFL